MVLQFGWPQNGTTYQTWPLEQPNLPIVRTFTKVVHTMARLAAFVSDNNVQKLVEAKQ